jgi:hypothetical protein
MYYFDFLHYAKIYNKKMRMFSKFRALYFKTLNLETLSISGKEKANKGTIETKIKNEDI